MVENHLHGERRDRRQIENVDVDLARAIGRIDGDVHGDHVRLRAKDAANGRLAILGECADRDAGVDDLEGVERRSERGDDIGGGHGQRDRPGAEDRMAAGEKLFGVDIGDGAGGGNFEVAANELHADGGAGHESGWAVSAGRDLRLIVRGAKRSWAGAASEPPAATGSSGFRRFAAARSGWLRGGIRS